MSQIGRKLRRWKVSLNPKGGQQTIGRSLVATGLGGCAQRQKIGGPLASNFPSGPFCFPAYMSSEIKNSRGSRANAPNEQQVEVSTQ